VNKCWSNARMFDSLPVNGASSRSSMPILPAASTILSPKWTSGTTRQHAHNLHRMDAACGLQHFMKLLLSRSCP